jgi:hypothetical protein
MAGHLGARRLTRRAELRLVPDWVTIGFDPDARDRAVADVSAVLDQAFTR